MTTVGGITVGRSDSVGGVVAGSVLVALLAMACLHLGSAGLVDPWHQTISDYVVVPGGYALLGAAASALAVACVMLAAALGNAGLPRPGRPAALLLSAAAALVLVAVFPTNIPGTEPGVVANVHRVAGGWVFAALPSAAWLVARRARAGAGWDANARILTLWSGVTGVLSIAFLLSHVPIVIGTSSGVPLVGGFERVLYAAVMVVMLVTARAAQLAMQAARTMSAASSPGSVAAGSIVDVGVAA
jgi:hypothetical protein